MKSYRKQFSCLSLFLLLILVFSTACSNSDGDVPSGMQKIVSEAKDYNLYVPKDWVVDTIQGMTSAAVGDAAKSSVSVSAVAMSSVEQDAAENYWNSLREQYEATFANWTLEEEGTETTLGDVKAYKYRFTGEISGITYQWMQVIGIRSGTYYTFTYTSTKDAYEDNIEDVISILEYFEFN